MAQAKHQKDTTTDREGQINFRYDKDKKDRLYAKAKEEGLPVSQLLASWCDEYIGDKPKSKPEMEIKIAKIEEMVQIALKKLEFSEGKLSA